MRVRQLTFRVTSSAAFAFLCLLLTAPAARAQSSDDPLTKQDIIGHWERNPRRDRQSYIQNMVKRRRVGFLPTRGVRRELSRRGVPAEVIDALRLHFSGDAEFKFQVWQFEAGPATLNGDQLAALARATIDGLRDRGSELDEVFTHYKPPLPEPCVQGQGGERCPESRGSLLQVKGRVQKSAGKLSAVVRLAYVSPTESQPIGGEQVVPIGSKTGEGLKAAAAEIVRRVHDNIKQEIKELF